MGWGGGHVNVPCTSYVICCYAAEISGVVAALYVATLQRSLVLLLRYMLLRCRDVWCCCYGVYTKGWGGGGMLTFLLLRTLYVATLQRSLVLHCVHEGVGRGGVGGGHSFQLMVSDTEFPNHVP